MTLVFNCFDYARARTMRDARSAHRLATVVTVTTGVLLLTHPCAASLPIQCPPAHTLASPGLEPSNFVTAEVKTGAETIQLKCLEDSELFPLESTNHYCIDSKCSQTHEIPASFVTIQKTLSGGSQYTITLATPQEKSATLYFQCRQSIGRGLRTHLKANDALDSTKTTCTFQIAAWGTTQSDEENEHDCTKFNDNNVVTLSQANQSVTLKCDSGTSFAPVNFENAFEEGDCNNERTLASLQLTGSTLVQGPSSDGKTPAYTLTVAKLPQDGPIKLCYRCNQAQLDLMRREAEPACIMRITVEADQRVDPELPNSDEAPPSEDSGSTHTSTSQTPTSGAVEEKPSLGSAILSACFLSHFALRVV